MLDLLPPPFAFSTETRQVTGPAMPPARTAQAAGRTARRPELVVGCSDANGVEGRSRLADRPPVGLDLDGPVLDESASHPAYRGRPPGGLMAASLDATTPPGG